ncbi:DUF6207 family protein [Streptomyces sp. 2132.2]|uniref:DUF6207 family protein n=1 Tax=Streptomyces sp. 2132.2 TaxID=2485161 RepID=UPI0021A6CFE8|nr:DUF6207 family protein [Streptomyces sp. 2132.2]
MVLDITGGGEDTVRAVMAELEERWATSGIGPVRRGSGRARCPGPDLRRRPAPGTGSPIATAPGQASSLRACPGSPRACPGAQACPAAGAHRG